MSAPTLHTDLSGLALETLDAPTPAYERTDALMLGLSQRTVWSMAGTGELPCLHIGSRLLFRVEALAAFAAERETAEQEARVERDAWRGAR